MTISSEHIQGNCLDVLPTLKAGSANCCVTSPPYWGLRDYGVDGQFGLESTPAEWVARMVEVFREVKRILTKDGTLWLNLGDSYSAGTNDDKSFRLSEGRLRSGLPRKNLMGMPWRLAFALQDDGWLLRKDIIWKKPNPMPESVEDRPTSAHEYLFLFAKQGRYYYDGDAIKEPVTGNAHPRGNGRNPKSKTPAYTGLNARWKNRQNESFQAAVAGPVETRNKRDVWTIPTFQFTGEFCVACKRFYSKGFRYLPIHRRPDFNLPQPQPADKDILDAICACGKWDSWVSHFATFPPDLVKDCILAGCPAGGTVLDPFGGAATVALVCQTHGRSCVNVELNPDYHSMGQCRVDEAADMLTGIAEGEATQ